MHLKLIIHESSTTRHSILWPIHLGRTFTTAPHNTNPSVTGQSDPLRRLPPPSKGEPQPASISSTASLIPTRIYTYRISAFMTQESKRRGWTSKPVEHPTFCSNSHRVFSLPMGFSWSSRESSHKQERR
ncbi:hypothetical protein AVEN_48953-1 [Araneus ventricosus]|uniref:Uncharacterized protein n=1 Tax=Araneus ventricosus TaxID=182803 RepID=A0A4Y2AGK8_ARAVE|nr:hypothetical protein AVEN_48953-1 [Araneus ventricosus]